MVSKIKSKTVSLMGIPLILTVRSVPSPGLSTASARLMGGAIVVFVVVVFFLLSGVVTTSVDDRRDLGLEGQVLCPESIVHSVGISVHQVAIAAFGQLDSIHNVRFAGISVSMEYIRSVAAEVAARLGAGERSQVVGRETPQVRLEVVAAVELPVVT